MIIKTTDEIWKGYEQGDLNFPSKKRWVSLADLDELLNDAEFIKVLNNNEYTEGALRTLRYIREKLDV